MALEAFEAESPKPPPYPPSHSGRLEVQEGETNLYPRSQPRRCSLTSCEMPRSA
jgi:hypothetical protein